MVDLRLLFVVLISTIHGLNFGVLAALLAAVSLVLGYMRQGIAPALLFYEPSYWLAFLVYFAAGAVGGYVQLHSTDAVRFAQEECGAMRQQMHFIRQLYPYECDMWMQRFSGCAPAGVRGRMGTG